MRPDNRTLILVLLLTLVPAARAQTTSLIPNPFSPGVIASIEGNQEPGVAIRLLPDSDSALFATVRIYNTQGIMVCHFLSGAWVSPEGLTAYWNGLSDHGKMVRNGRYVVVTQWSRNATAKPFSVQRHSLVVFK